MVFTHQRFIYFKFLCFHLTIITKKLLTIFYGMRIAINKVDVFISKLREKTKNQKPKTKNQKQKTKNQKP